MDPGELRFRALLKVVGWASENVVDAEESWGDGIGLVLSPVSRYTKRLLAPVSREFAVVSGTSDAATGP